MRLSKWKSREEQHLSRVRLFEIGIVTTIGIGAETVTETETLIVKSRRMYVCPRRVTQLSINRQTFVNSHDTSV